MWGVWMLTQLAQIALVLGASGMYVAAYYSLRHQTRACLLTDDVGNYRLDRFLLHTVLIQPVIVSKIALVFVYSFILSTAARAPRLPPTDVKSKEDFKAVAAKDGFDRGGGLRPPRTCCCASASSPRASAWCCPPKVGYAAALAWVVAQERLGGARLLHPSVTTACRCQKRWPSVARA